MIRIVFVAMSPSTFCLACIRKGLVFKLIDCYLVWIIRQSQFEQNRLSPKIIMLRVSGPNYQYFNQIFYINHTYRLSWKIFNLMEIWIYIFLNFYHSNQQYLKLLCHTHYYIMLKNFIFFWLFKKYWNTK